MKLFRHKYASLLLTKHFQNVLFVCVFIVVVVGWFGENTEFSMRRKAAAAAATAAAPATAATATATAAATAATAAAAAIHAATATTIFPLVKKEIQAPFLFKHGKRCTPIQTESIAAQEPIRNSNCPIKNGWMSSLLASSYNNSFATLISIGCNRGDDLLSQIREWSRNSSYSLESMMQKNELFFGHRSCPISGDMVIDERFIRPVSGFCVEAMHSTFSIVDKIYKDLGWDTMVHVIHAAVSSTPGTTQFPIDSAGVESLGIGSSAVQTESVHVITIDELVEQNAIEVIDILSIDTEGNDMRVIIGAVKSLSRVRYLEFEYHEVNRWARSDLQDLIDLLDQFGFDCFWSGNAGQLWRLTGCWHDSYYAKRFWSNVACTNRKEEMLLQTMEALAELNI